VPLTGAVVASLDGVPQFLSLFKYTE